jgi:hypothetical protein
MLHRRWNLFDSMVLISATALGLGSARWWYNQPGYVNPSALNAQSASEIVAWLLLPMSPALIAIRLREPRPPWRRRVRQPGLQANLVICLATVSGLLNSRGETDPIGTGSPR